ncbi:MAG: hypothetical protein OIN83_02925 [Candidatus Methanoperedens sp.]|nr:hypothetical protein [Candidatus Methanoperedens sp.]
MIPEYINTALEKAKYEIIKVDVVVSEVYHNCIRVKICDNYKIQPIDFTRFIKLNPNIISELDMKGYNLLSSDAIHVSS